MFAVFSVFIFSSRVCAWSNHWVFCDGEECVTVSPATCSEPMGKNQLIRLAKLHSAKVKEKTIYSQKLLRLEGCLLEGRAGTKSAGQGRWTQLVGVNGHFHDGSSGF